MARVRKCDRCGKYYEPKCGVTAAVGVTEFNMDNDQEYPEVYSDLCPECHDSFVAWMDEVGYKDVVEDDLK